MNPKDELLSYKRIVDQKLAEYFDRKIKEYSSVSPFIEEFVKHLAEFTLRGGKRLRPALIYYTYKAFGGEEDEEVRNISLFIEIIQSFLLIHDDIMDHADLRRSGATVHKIYEKYSQEKGYSEPEHIGITMAILAGDLANQMAYELIAESNFKDKVKLLKLLKLFTSQLTGVVFGQIHDILLTYEDRYDQQDIFKVHHYKTAKYTYEIPVICGAILAGVSDEDIGHLVEFSIYAGTAFQIHDDVLGVFGDDENTGKPTISDLREGKKTLLTLKASESGSDEQRKMLQEYLGKKDLSDKEAELVKQIMRDTGALEFSKQKCRDMVKAAQLNLDNIQVEKSKYFEFLYQIAEYSISRDN
jgi:geranylgeranyl diphosphate synthase type I